MPDAATQVDTLDDEPIAPFAGASFDSNGQQPVGPLTITLSDANGTPTDADGYLTDEIYNPYDGAYEDPLQKTGPGTYVLAADSYATVAWELEQLTFTPTEAQVPIGQTVVTGISVTDAGSSDLTVSVNAIAAQAVDDPPNISFPAGYSDSHESTDFTPYSPFQGVTVTDPDTGGERVAAEIFAVDEGITYLAPADGTLSGPGLIALSQGGSYELLAASPGDLSAELSALAFTPAPGDAGCGLTVGILAEIYKVDADGNYVSGTDSYIGAYDSVSAPPPATEIDTTDEDSVAPFQDDSFTASADPVGPIVLTLSDSTGTPTDANGILSGTGVVQTGVGTYTLAADTLDTISGELTGLIFIPTAHQVAPGDSVTTSITLTDAGGTGLTDQYASGYTIVATAAEDPPDIAGFDPLRYEPASDAAHPIPVTTTFRPFQGISLSDPDFGPPADMTAFIFLSSSAVLSGAGLVVNGDGFYTFAPAAPDVLAAELAALVFTPAVEDAGSSVDFELYLDVTKVDAQGNDLADTRTATVPLSFVFAGAMDLTAPATVALQQGRTGAIDGISLSWTSAAAAPQFTVTVADTAGFLAATGPGVSGLATRCLTITGTLDAVNAALATLTDTDGTAQADTITVTVTDSVDEASSQASIGVTVTPSPAQLPTYAPAPITLTSGTATLVGEIIGGYTVRLEGTSAGAATPAIQVSCATINSNETVLVGDASATPHFGHINLVGYMENHGVIEAMGAGSRLAINIANATDANGAYLYQGALNNYGAITALSGSTIDIAGDAGSKLINNGSITSSGMMFINELVSGSGKMVVNAGGSLELGGAVSTGQAVTQNTGGVLTIDDLADFFATIHQTAAGGRIYLGAGQPQPDSFTYTNGRLDLYEGTTRIGALHFFRPTGTTVDQGSFQLTQATATTEAYFQVTPHHA